MVYVQVAMKRFCVKQESYMGVLSLVRSAEDEFQARNVGKLMVTRQYSTKAI